MYKLESEAKTAALKLCQQDSLSSDAYIPLYDKKSDSFVIYPRVSTLLFKASKTGLLAGKLSCIHTHDENNNLVSSKTSLFKLVMDDVQEFQGDEVFYEEYKNPNAKWHKEKPHMFMSKIALAVALRVAFADILTGLISYEEARCELDFGTQKSVAVKNEDLVGAAGTVVTKIPDAPSTRSIVEEVFGVKK